MKIKFLFLLLFALIVSSCNETTSSVETLFEHPIKLLYSTSVSDQVWVVDEGKGRYFLYSMEKGGFVDLLEGEGISGLPFPSGFSFVDGAVGKRGLLAVYSNGDTREVVFHPLGEPPYTEYPPEEFLDIPAPQRVFYEDGKWGFLYSGKLIFYGDFFTYQTDITFPVEEVWRKVVADGDRILLLPALHKRAYVLSISDGSFRILQLDFLPADGAFNGDKVFLAGGGNLYYGDPVTGWFREKRLERVFDFVYKNRGALLGEYSGDYFGLMSARGGLYFVRPDLCFISRYRPAVENKYFVDLGDPSDPDLEVGDFSSCIGDVPDDTFTLYFGAEVQGGSGYVVGVTSSTCFVVDSDVDWSQARRGDLVIVKGDHFFKEYSLAGGKDRSVCVNEEIVDEIKGMSFSIKMDGYALFSSREGYIGRIPRKGKLNLGYAVIEVKEGDKPVTTGDYFVFSLASGMDPMIVEGAGYTYTLSSIVYSFPAGIVLQSEKAYLLYEYSPLFAVLSLENGEILWQVR